MRTHWFISRHPAAIRWALRSSVRWRLITHWSALNVQPGDVVAGTLPVHLAARVCALGANYFHLVLELQAEDRGLELDDVAFSERKPRLQAFEVTHAQRDDA